MTVAFASAVPITLGLLLFDGDAGDVLVIVGVAGGLESSVYATPDAEQAPVLPAASVAFAQYVVVTFDGAVTMIENAPAPVAVPDPATAEVHDPFVNSFTVELPSALPLMVGVVLFDGDVGLTLRPVGAFGAI